MQRKTSTYVVTAVLVAMIGALIFVSWRAVSMGQRGWAGLSYNPAAPAEDVPQFGMLRRTPGELTALVPGGPAERAGLAAGDLIIAINTIPVTEKERLRQFAATTEGGERVVYRIARGGEEQQRVVTLGSPLSNAYTMIDAAVSVLIGLAFVAISLLVYVKKPESPRAFLFFLTSVTSGFMLFSWAVLDLEKTGRGILPNEPGSFFFSIYAVFLLLAIAMGSLLLHFALVFPRPAPVILRHPRIVRSVYLVPLLPALIVMSFVVILPVVRWNAALALTAALAAVVAGAVAVVRVVARAGAAGLLDRPSGVYALVVSLGVLPIPLIRLGGRSTATVAGIFYGLSLALLVTLIGFAWALLTCAALVHSYRRAGVEERRQIRWPLWGIIVSLAIAAAAGAGNLLLANLSPGFWSREAWLALAVSIAMKAAYLLIPVAFAFAILRYRLMDIDFIIKKTVVYGTLTGMIVLLYFIFVVHLGSLVVRAAGVTSQVVTIASTLVIAAMLIPARNRLQDFVDRRFFRRRHDYPLGLRRIGEEIGAAENEGQLLTSVAVLVREALQVRSAEILPRDRALDSAEDPAALVVPIEADGRQTHEMMIGPKLSDEEIDEEDRDFIYSVAGQLALALENLRSRQEEREYEKAREIQQALLPSELPQLNGIEFAGSWHPAREIGGDYFDAISLSESSVGVCIADVVGKGMPAALLMSGLQAALRAVAADDLSPSEVCRRVRKVVGRNLSGGKFITFFYGVVDQSSRTFRYTNAGHNPPVLLRRDGSTQMLAEGGAAFGRLFLQTDFGEGSVVLGEGDRIMLYSDGLSEAARDGEQFGDDRLIGEARRNASSSAVEINERVMAAVREFSGRALADDATMVVIAVR